MPYVQLEPCSTAAGCSLCSNCMTAALRRAAGELGPKLPGPPGPRGWGGCQLISSSRVWRVSAGVMCGEKPRAAPRSAQALLSLPTYLGMSVESLTSSTIAWQVMVPGLPLTSVLPLQACGYAASGLGQGSRIRPLYETISQPRPNAESQGSSFTFDRPQERKVSAAHALALRLAGELVSRAPITSVR